MKVSSALIFCLILMINTPILAAKETVETVRSDELPRVVQVNDARYSAQLKKFNRNDLFKNNWKIKRNAPIVKSLSDPRPLLIKRNVKHSKTINKSHRFRFRQLDLNKQRAVEQSQLNLISINRRNSTTLGAVSNSVSVSNVSVIEQNNEAVNQTSFLSKHKNISPIKNRILKKEIK